MSKEIKETVVEVVEEVATAVDQQANEVIETAPAVTVDNEAQPKKSLWGWTKDHALLIGGAVAAAGAVIFFGKKVYQAGMPAEFELPESVSEVAEDVVDVVEENVNSEE
jgi:hypothetical protein